MADQSTSQGRSPQPAPVADQVMDADPPLDHGSTAEAEPLADEALVGPETYKAPIAGFYDVASGGGKQALSDAREAYQEVVGLVPKLGEAARANADFVLRAVAVAAADARITQFLDLGCGFPRQDRQTVYSIARRYRPDARVAYVDNDPVVACHGRALLDRPGSAWTVQADVRDVRKVLEEAGKHLDLARPTGVIMAALVHFWPDHDDPYSIVDAYLEAFRSGLLIFTHASADGLSFRDRAKAVHAYARIAPLYLRSEAAIGSFMDGLTVWEPGLVEASTWRPDTPIAGDVGEAHFLAAVAEFGRSA
ncbi:SAM-dependent methyltransferase [Nonomuraea sp. NPDC050394]|uniref:SAM-dependent methyltransferase n=1 Tax=Nonomuraea sp. NPDC050394 TaxID=3364363 RepID=UPI0037B5AE83